MRALFGNLLPSRNERLLKTYRTAVRRINGFADACKQLDDAALGAKRAEFKTRFDNGESMEQLLPEAFAVVREASERALGLRHFDVQLMGGIALHQGRVAEMSTGEGKTLVATLPAYLNSLGGKGVHIVTVNDYLARRDAEWMGAVYRFLGMETGVIVSGQNPDERRLAYQGDVIYGTNNEFGFDYLRDNMALAIDEMVQPDHDYAIVDEVDSVLIDEARTPLIISGPAAGGVEIYTAVNELVRSLRREREEGDGGDYTVDEKTRQATLTENGHQRVEDLLIKKGMLAQGDSLYDYANIGLLHHVGASLRAASLFKKNVDYIVRGGKILIVDEFTGRVMPGRRWSDGLHQAIEAKEGVKIEAENQTFASITFQNYFRLYRKLAGMTGTADTEAYELHDIYKLEVVVLPTHKQMIRDDQADQIYMTQTEKFEAIAADIKECVANGQPVLAGTASIAVSEHLSGLLKKAGIEHQVLNAKHHEAESRIIAQAGRPGVVTIATNMAGRGTDIVLGGSLDAELSGIDDDGEKEKTRSQWRARHQRVVDAGGLRIVGTERHESRRIDNQLRGRSGRQGDPGSSRFYLSLEDNLMRIFASDKVKTIMDKFGMESGEAIEHRWVTRAIENAQRKVEAHNFDIRKTLLEYDDVVNEQRRIIYGQRYELMKSDDISDSVDTIMEEVAAGVVEGCVPRMAGQEWDTVRLETVLKNDFDLHSPVSEWCADADVTATVVRDKVLEDMQLAYRQKRDEVGAENLRAFESVCMLRTLDRNWKDHLMNIDYLRQGIGLRSFAQKNPKQEYKREAFGMFESMLDRIRYEFIVQLMKIKVSMETEPAPPEPRSDSAELGYRHAPAADLLHPQDTPPPPPAAAQAAPPPKHAPLKREHPKIGRNDPCFCGSGKKYKRCHGAGR